MAFAGAPSLHLAAHEAAHVIQQRQGVQRSAIDGGPGDFYEQHAEQVAERVVAGQSAEALLDGVSGSAGAGPAVQRYAIEHGHRVSNARQIATPDVAEQQRKHFLAVPAVIARSNLVLEGMRSKVMLVEGADAGGQLAGLKQVTPARRDEEPTELFDVNECVDVSDRVTGSGQSHAIYQPPGGDKTVQKQSPYDLGRLNKVIELLTQRQDVAPGHVTEAQDEQARREEPIEPDEVYQFNFRDIQISTSSGKEASDELADAIQDKNLRAALLLDLLKDDAYSSVALQQRVVDHLDGYLETIELQATEPKAPIDQQKREAWRVLLEELIQTAEQLLLDNQQQQARLHQNQQSGLYAQLPDEAKSERAQQLGVNEHAQPEVGEAYAVASTRERTQEDGEKWSFHFAAVVARDGGDAVTLENYNRNKGGDGNPEWYFDMQGPREQSFHDKHKDTVADGLTLRMGEAATEDLKDDFRRRIAEKLGAEVPEGPLLRIASAVTRAELAAIYADACEGR